MHTTSLPVSELEGVVTYGVLAPTHVLELPVSTIRLSNTAGEMAGNCWLVEYVQNVGSVPTPTCRIKQNILDIYLRNVKRITVHLQHS